MTRREDFKISSARFYRNIIIWKLRMTRIPAKKVWREISLSECRSAFLSAACSAERCRYCVGYIKILVTSYRSFVYINAIRRMPFRTSGIWRRMSPSYNAIPKTRPSTRVRTSILRSMPSIPAVVEKYLSREGLRSDRFYRELQMSLYSFFLDWEFKKYREERRFILFPWYFRLWVDWLVEWKDVRSYQR